jgi:uncharacterized protein (DUF983 family)
METVSSAPTAWTLGFRERRKAQPLDRDEARLFAAVARAAAKASCSARSSRSTTTARSAGSTYTPHRADDLPAYLVIIIVGHIVVPVVLWVETNYSPAIWLQLSIYLPFTFISSLLLLPVKGAVVGFQWAMRMHGFDENAPGEVLLSS